MTLENTIAGQRYTPLLSCASREDGAARRPVTSVNYRMVMNPSKHSGSTFSLQTWVVSCSAASLKGLNSPAVANGCNKSCQTNWQLPFIWPKLWCSCPSYDQTPMQVACLARPCLGHLAFGI